MRKRNKSSQPESNCMRSLLVHVIVANLVGGVHGFEIPELVQIVTPRSRSDRGVTARVKIFKIHDHRPRGW